MAFLTHFENDVHISYAHVDDQPLGGGRGEGWVTKFWRQMQQQLWLYHGSEVPVWRDSDLKAAEAIDVKIEQQLNQTGIVLALLSNSYLKSAYCRKERQ